MRTLVRTISIVQNVVKPLSSESPNKPQAIGTLGIDDAVTTVCEAKHKSQLSIKQHNKNDER